MNGRPNLTGGPAPGRPEEDLDGVLSRFQNWTKMHQETVSGTMRGTPQENAKFVGGAREVSYEQALRRSGYRRPVDTPPVGAPVAAAAPAPATAASLAEAAKPKTTTPGKKMATAARAKAPAARKSTISYPASESPTKAGPAAGSPASRGAETASGRARNSPQGGQIVPATSARKRGRPAFDEVLRESALAHSSPAALATLETAGTITLTLRMAEAEHAKIQARAAFANLSVSEYLLQCALGQSMPGDPGMAAAHERQSISAYLRHCAAGIDELRDRVEAIALNSREDPLRAAAPLPPTPGFWSRIGGKLFRRGRGDDYPSSISLR
jgi:hypothetical protein